MTIDDKIRDEELQYGINKEAVSSIYISKKYQQYHRVKVINMNILQVKKSIF